MEDSKLLRLPAVLEVTGLKKSTIYARVKSGTFPKPVKVSSRTIAWHSSEVTRCIEELPRA